MRKQHLYLEVTTDLRAPILGVLVLLALLLFPSILFAQEGLWHPVYKNYTTADGLPSMEGYYSVQDKDGYMWFATDRGVARFNGEEFKLFTTDDGLISNTIFKIAPDDNGRLWFLSNEARLCYYENGKIVPYKYNDKLEAHFKGDIIVTYTSWKFKNDEVMISTSFKDPIHIDKDGNVTLPKNKGEQIEGAKMTVFLYNGELVNINNYESSSTMLIGLDINVNDRTRIDLFENHPIIGNHACLGWIDKNSIYYSESNELVTSSNNATKKYLFESIIVNISKVKNELWIAFFEGGIQCFNWKDDSLIPGKRLFEDKAITSTFEDDEGNMWFTSLNSGVFKVSDTDISRLKGFSELNEGSSLIGNQGDRLFISSNLHGFHVYNNALGDMETLERQPLRLVYNGMLKIPITDEIFIVSRDELYPTRLFNQDRFEIYPQSLEMLTVRRIDEGRMLIGNHVGIYSITETNKIKLAAIPNGVHSMELNGDHCLWLANFGTLKVFDLNTNVLSEPTIELLQQRMNDVLKVNEYTLFGTNGNGLILKKGQTITQLNSSNGFPRNFVNKIHEGRNGTIWVMGYNGITQLKLNKDGTFLFRDFPALTMMTEKLNDFTVGEKFTYLATNNGVVRIDNDFKTSELIPPRLHLTGIEINGTAKNIKDMNLPYSSNNVLIKFDAASFENRPIVFRFRSHSTEEWTLITERFVRLTSLPPGTYQFEIQASLDHKKWVSSEPVIITIHPPFWKTWWFIILVAIFVIFLASILISIRIKSVRKKYTEQQKILQMQQEALSQQMNPHFIFNALGSVQNSMLKGETLQANSYLVKFSKLLRAGLNASRSQLITIKEDSELMRNYLNVEQTRMKGSFTFEVLVDNEGLSSSLLIPPFLLQPFIENAIKHGFSDEVNNVHIIVKYEEREKDIQCVISDNGAGRRAAMNNSSGRIKHAAHGSDIAFQRILLINKTKGFTSHIETLDLQEEHNKSSGTKVVFTIPIIRE